MTGDFWKDCFLYELDPEYCDAELILNVAIELYLIVIIYIYMFYIYVGDYTFDEFVLM